MTQLPLTFEADDREARARVWLWCTHLMTVERDARRAEWPVPAEGVAAYHADLDMIEAAADRFYAKAEEVAGGLRDESWREALEAFSG